MPRPLIVRCRATTREPPEELAARILDVDQWSHFRGWGPIPGIRSAAFESQTPEIVGSRIRVTNTDGSTHVETITAWDPPHAIELTFDEFDAPLCRLAAGFVERMEFKPSGDGHDVVRTLVIRPHTAFTRVLLLPVRFMLRQALKRHLRDLLDA